MIYKYNCKSLPFIVRGRPTLRAAQLRTASPIVKCARTMRIVLRCTVRAESFTCLRFTFFKELFGHVDVFVCAENGVELLSRGLAKMALVTLVGEEYLEG